MKLEVKRLNKTIKFSFNLPRNLEKGFTNGNEQFMKNLKRTSKFKAPRSSGETKRSIKIDKTKAKGKTKQWKLISDSPNTIFILKGRKPGKAPPLQELMKWNKLSTTKAGQQDKWAAALVLSRHIAQHGTKPNDFILRALEHNLNKFSQNMDRHLDRGISKS